MSRGYWEYRNEYLKTEIFGCYDECRNVFEDREISEIIFDMFDLLYAFDSYMSGDWSEAKLLGKKRKFKTKWFKTAPEERMKHIIDKELIECKKSLYKTFGIEEE